MSFSDKYPKPSPVISEESSILIWALICFVFGMVVGISVSGPSDWEANHIHQVRMAVAQCEAELPRHLECDVVINARVKPSPTKDDNELMERGGS